MSFVTVDRGPRVPLDFRRNADWLDEMIREVDKQLLFAPHDTHPRFIARLVETRKQLKMDLQRALNRRAWSAA